MNPMPLYGLKYVYVVYVVTQFSCIQKKYLVHVACGCTCILVAIFSVFRQRVILIVKWACSGLNTCDCIGTGFTCSLCQTRMLLITWGKHYCLNMCFSTSLRFMGSLYETCMLVSKGKYLVHITRGFDGKMLLLGMHLNVFTLFFSNV